MKPEFPKCGVETTFEIPSSTNFGERRKISLESDCENIAKIIKDNLVPETQVSKLESSVTVQVKSRKIENYTLTGTGITDAKKVADVFQKFDSYSKSNLLVRYCKGFLLTLMKNPIHIKREKDTPLKGS